MKLYSVTILATAIFLITSSCSSGGSSSEKTSPSVSSYESENKNLRIIFKWPGDDFASRQALETRAKIEKRIMERAVGKIIRTGTGMGWMDIVVEVKSGEDSRIEIERMIREMASEIKFAIEIIEWTEIDY